MNVGEEEIIKRTEVYAKLGGASTLRTALRIPAGAELSSMGLENTEQSDD